MFHGWFTDESSFWRLIVVSWEEPNIQNKGLILDIWHYSTYNYQSPKLKITVLYPIYLYLRKGCRTKTGPFLFCTSFFWLKEWPKAHCNEMSGMLKVRSQELIIWQFYSWPGADTYRYNLGSFISWFRYLCISGVMNLVEAMWTWGTRQIVSQQPIRSLGAHGKWLC